MRKSKTSGIYCIENTINHKKYIGQSINIEARLYKHKYELQNDKHFNDYLQKAWRKYGETSFDFYIIEKCDQLLLDERECYYIDFYNTMNREFGYNLVTGGTLGRQYSEESREKQRQAMLGHYVSEETRMKIKLHHADVSKEKNPNFKNRLSDAQRQRISECNKGRVSHRRNITPVRCVELGVVYKDATEAKNQLGFDSSGILKCCKKERKTCGGFHWEFAELGNNIC